MKRPLTEVLDELVKAKMQIEQWKAEHPENAEIVQMIEDYLRLFAEVQECWQPPTVIYPHVGPVLNPVLINPAPVVIRPLPYQPPWTVTCEAGT
jgi:hypothetical protein